MDVRLDFCQYDVGCHGVYMGMIPGHIWFKPSIYGFVEY